ncbi:MAG: bifunctional 1-(5-phosphoribosyl)-5-((5-phosphoribosylamino)methylideneamino)imidazole-4-carboxamide isomerase/phosphoribosylanthranilate isomerase PriA [Actinobacteria bacterium]|nr:bifunctional 1-(5-phosphoribosyl)-5-((5-phosphoribosylamino)methylideneamino)imidazole-4-carboxamide isomerase/phosphoribosylanthranilate isomerase PriA [Actinomycetota bacterium]
MTHAEKPAPALQLLPAVDVADSQAVRLVQGKAGSETVYGRPIDAARSWVEQGAEWIHLVDLDAAFSRGSNATTIGEVVNELKGQVRIGNLWETLGRLDAAGCSRYVVTDVHKDGTMKGPNIHLLRDVCSATDAAIVASGGISRLEDLHTLADMTGQGIEGAIIGRALYEGAFTLAEAIAAVEARYDPYEWGPPRP